MNVLIICNPKSGLGVGLKFKEEFIEKFKSLGVNAQTFDSSSVEYTKLFFKDCKKNNLVFDAVIIMGGDGTVGRTVDAMIKAGLNYPVLPFPVGTANDYAWFLKISQNVDKCVDLIMKNKPIASDIAIANGEYVINVIGGGLFTHDYTKYNKTAKKFFGKLAYWVKALQDSFKVRYQRFSINIDGEEIREDLCFFSVMNGSSAGGMHKLGIQADVNDGKFEFVAFKKCNLFQRFKLFLKVKAGKHLKCKYIIYKKGRQFSIRTVHEKIKGYEHCDIDGDEGPKYPIQIKIRKGELKVFTARKDLLNENSGN